MSRRRTAARNITKNVPVQSSAPAPRASLRSISRRTRSGQNVHPKRNSLQQICTAARADEYPQGAGRICNAPSSRTAALGIGPYKVYRRFSDFHTPQVQSKALVDRRGPGKASESFPRSLFFCQAFSFWRSKKKMPSVSPFLEKANKENNVDTKPARNF